MSVVDCTLINDLPVAALGQVIKRHKCRIMSFNLHALVLSVRVVLIHSLPYCGTQLFEWHWLTARSILWINVNAAGVMIYSSNVVMISASIFRVSAHNRKLLVHITLDHQKRSRQYCRDVPFQTH